MTTLGQTIDLPVESIDTANFIDAMHTQGGRKQVASILCPVLTRELDRKRKLHGMPLSLLTQPCFGYKPLPQSHLYKAQFTVERYLRSPGVFRRSLDRAISSLFVDELQQWDRYLSHCQMIVPMEVKVGRNDTAHLHRLGFRLRQRYAVIDPNRVA